MSCSLPKNLAHLLFLFCINNLVSSLTNGVVIVLFADVVSILTTGHKKEDAEAAAQSVVNSGFDWSMQWKLNLKADESEVCPFPCWSNNSTWQHVLFIGNNQIQVYHTPRLRDVIRDRSLMFNERMKKLTVSKIIVKKLKISILD